MTAPNQQTLIFVQALAERSDTFAAAIDAELAGSSTIFAEIEPARRLAMARAIVEALARALADGDPTPLRQLQDSDQLPRERGFGDAQLLFALTRRATLNVLRPEIAAHPEAGVELVDQLGALLGAVREAEVAWQISQAEERALHRAAELQTALHRMETSFATSPLATLEADTQGRITRWNPAAERIFGWTAEEAIGRNAIELLVPGLAREHVETFVGSLLSGNAADSRNINVRKDGQMITCQWYNAVLHNPDGSVAGWLSQTQDVTEQIRYEQALRLSEIRLRLLLESLPLLVFTLNREGIFTYSDGRALGTLGLAPGQLVGTSSLEFYKDHPESLDALKRALSGESLNVTISFDTISFDVWYQPLYDDRGNLSGTLGLAFDISDRIRADRERLELQEEVISAQRAALRELGTPIVPIVDGVIAMPLIGSIDSSRAQQVIESLLSGVAERSAHTAILDITGVQVVDTQVADALLRAARAVKLLGTQVILTGIRPEVAQTLVGLGLDLSGVVTLSSLQSGIAYALRQG